MSWNPTHILPSYDLFYRIQYYTTILPTCLYFLCSRIASTINNTLYYMWRHIVPLPHNNKLEEFNNYTNHPPSSWSYPLNIGNERLYWVWDFCLCSYLCCRISSIAQLLYIAYPHQAVKCILDMCGKGSIFTLCLCTCFLFPYSSRISFVTAHWLLSK